MNIRDEIMTQARSLGIRDEIIQKAQELGISHGDMPNPTPEQQSTSADTSVRPMIVGAPYGEVTGDMMVQVGNETDQMISDANQAAGEFVGKGVGVGMDALKQVADSGVLGPKAQTISQGIDTAKAGALGATTGVATGGKMSGAGVEAMGTYFGIDAVRDVGKRVNEGIDIVPPHYANITEAAKLGPGALMQWTAYSVGNAMGSSAPTYLGGALGGLATGGNPMGVAVGAALPSYVQATGDIYNTILEESPDIDPVEASRLALMVAPLYAGVDMAGPAANILRGMGVKTFDKAFKREGVKHLLRYARENGWIKAGLREGGRGVVTEGLPEGWQLLITGMASEYAKEGTADGLAQRAFNDMMSPEFLNETAAGSVGGTVTGGAAGIKESLDTQKQAATDAKNKRQAQIDRRYGKGKGSQALLEGTVADGMRWNAKIDEEDDGDVKGEGDPLPNNPDNPPAPDQDGVGGDDLTDSETADDNTVDETDEKNSADANDEMSDENPPEDEATGETDTEDTPPVSDEDVVEEEDGDTAPKDETDTAGNTDMGDDEVEEEAEDDGPAPKKEVRRLTKGVSNTELPEGFNDGNIYPDVFADEDGQRLQGGGMGGPVILEVYRGSSDGERDIYAEGVTEPALGKGRYTALSENVAKTYGDKIEKLEVALQNPYVIDDATDIEDLMGGQPIPMDNENRKDYLKELREAIESEGYDGVIVQVPVWTNIPASKRGSTDRITEIFGDTQVVEFNPPSRPATQSQDNDYSPDDLKLLEDARAFLETDGVEALDNTLAYSLRAAIDAVDAGHDRMSRVKELYEQAIAKKEELATSKEKKPETPPKPKDVPETPKYESNNKIFTDDAATKARELLRKKLNNINTGIDPEVMQAGITLAGWHIEKGARSFASFSKSMIEDLGENVKPYLKSWYMAVKYDPRTTESEFASEFDAEDTIDEFIKGEADGISTDEVGADGDTSLEETSSDDVQDDATTSRGSEESGSRSTGSGQGGNQSADGQGGESGDSEGDSTAPTDTDEVGSGGTDAEQNDGTGNGSASAGNESDTEKPIDYKYTNTESIGSGGQKTKFKANINAIKTLKAIEAEDRPATPEEKEILAQFTGWGHTPQVFRWTVRELNRMKDTLPADTYESIEASVQESSKWRNEAQELEDLLTEEEYKAARAATTNSHYTSPTVIEKMWEAIGRLGLTKGRILEPSSGIGLFLGLRPDSFRGNTQHTAVELDSVSGRIAKLLYPQAKVSVQGYESVRLPDNFYDLAISNVPFMDMVPNDPTYNKHGLFLHDYFFAKSIDKVRPGGVVAFVTSRGTMDKVSPKLRELLYEKADLLGAIRLPNTAFQSNAHTQVTTDIIFLRKRAEGEPAGDDSWLSVGTQGGIRINQYFIDNPDMMAGKMTLTGSMYGANEPTLEADGRALEDALSEIIAKLPEGAVSNLLPQKARQADEIVLAEDDIRPNMHVVSEDGKILVRIGDEMVEWEASDNVAPLRMRGMINIRNLARKILRLQVEGATEEEITDAQAQLQKAYDAFVKKYKPLNTTKNRNLFMEDVDAALVLSLEKWDAENGKVISLADIFTKRTIPQANSVMAAENAIDAMYISLARYGEIDMEYMKQIYDKSEEEIVEELGDAMFLDPEGGYVEANEYLAGDVRKKLEMAKIAAESDEIYERNVASLEEVQPKDLPIEEISVRLGAPTIPKSIFEDFSQHLFKSTLNMDFVAASGKWAIKDDEHYSAARQSAQSYSQWGVEREDGGLGIDGVSIFSKLMSGESITVYDRVDDKYVVNKKLTQRANARATAMQNEFVSWVRANADQALIVEKEFNEKYNNLVDVKHDGKHLKFPGMTSQWQEQMRPHQRNAVWRSIREGNALFGHVVGSGKTATIVASVMERKRLGLAKKPMVTVLKSTINQWRDAFYEMYPGAKVLVVSENDFKPKKREALFGRIATGDWDAVILTHEQMGSIGLSEENEQRFLREQLEEIESALLAARAERGKTDNFVKELEKIKAKWESKLAKLAKAKKASNMLTFEEMGFDAIYVDEAHYFKNLFYFTSMNRIASIGTPGGNDKSFNLFMKTQYLQRLNGGHGVFLATGTPITNTMAEIFTMQRYLQYDQLKEKNIHMFDSWARMFGSTKDVTEMKPSGVGYRVKTRFAKFVNVPELMKMFRRVLDIQTADMLGLPRPEVDRITVKSPPSEWLKSFVAWLNVRARELEGTRPEEGADNILNVVGDGRKAALDWRLIDKGYPQLIDGKVDKVASEVYRIWDERKEEKATQLIFSDLGTPVTKKTKKKKNDDADVSLNDEDDESRYNVYQAVKDALLARGVPEEEIAFIHDFDTDAKRATLSAKFKAGEIRILIGSTQKMGVGMNLQDRLYALHHIDAPWTPAGLEQRNGRGERQGNMYYDMDVPIQIKNYVTEESFDVYVWQTLETKANFIGQVMTGGAVDREMEDVDTSAQEYEAIKLIASGNPDAIRKMELEREVEGLQEEENAHRAKLRSAKNRKDILLFQRKETEVRIEKVEDDIKQRGDTENFHMVIDGTEYTDRKKANDAIIKYLDIKGVEIVKEKETSVVYRIHRKMDFGETKIGEIYGLDIVVYRNASENVPTLHVKGSTSYEVQVGGVDTGLVTRIDNQAKRPDAELKWQKEVLDSIDSDIKNLDETLETEFDKQEELTNKKLEIEELEAALQEAGVAEGEEALQQEREEAEKWQKYEVDERGNFLNVPRKNLPELLRNRESTVYDTTTESVAPMTMVLVPSANDVAATGMRTDGVDSRFRGHGHWLVSATHLDDKQIDLLDRYVDDATISDETIDEAFENAWHKIRDDVELEEIGVIDNGKQKNGVLYDGEIVLVDPDYYRYLTTHLTYDSMYRHQDEDQIVFMYNGEVVGLLMGLDNENLKNSLNIDELRDVLSRKFDDTDQDDTGGTSNTQAQGMPSGKGKKGERVATKKEPNPDQISLDEIGTDPSVPPRGAPHDAEMSNRRLSVRMDAPAGNRNNPTSRPDIINAMVRLMKSAGANTPIRKGRFRQRALGIYKVYSEVIRLKYQNDVATGLHEVGHAMDKTMAIREAITHLSDTRRIAINRELVALGKELYGDTNPSGGYASEGIAEIFYYMLATDQAQQKAPRMTEWFLNDFLPQHPEVEIEFNRVKGLVGEWKEQGALRRVEMSIAHRKTLLDKVQGWSYEKIKDYLATVFYESAHPIYKVVEMAKTLSDDPIRTSKDPFKILTARRMTHIATTKFMVEQGMVDITNVNVVGKSLKEVMAPIEGLHDEFVQYLFASRALALHYDPKGNPRDPGISAEDAQYVKDYYDNEYPRFAKVAREYYEWNDGVLNYLAQSSPSLRILVQRIVERDPGNYVPLQREMEDMAKRYVTSRGTGNPIARLRGSGARIKDPIESTILNTSRLLLAAHQRMVVDAIIDLSKIEGMGHLVEEVPRDIAVDSHSVAEVIDRLSTTLIEMGVLDEESAIDTDGMDEDMLNAMVSFFGASKVPKGRDPVIPVAVGSSIKFYQVPKELYENLMGMDVYHFKNWFARIHASFVKVFKAGVTGLSASFGLLRNPIRDIFTMYAQTLSNSRLAMGLMGNYVKALYDSTASRLPSVEDTEWMKLYKSLGIEMAQILGEDSRQLRHSARKLTHKTNPLKVRTIGEAGDIMGDLFDWYRDLIQAPESAPRIAEMRTIANQMGWEIGQPITMDQALELQIGGKRATTDFTAAGTFSRWYNQVVPFFNAAIQGPRTVARRLKDPETRTNTLLRMGLSVLVPTLLLWWENKDEDWWKKMDWREKFMNWYVKVDDTVLRIPRPFDIGIFFAALPEMLIESIYNEDPEATKEWFGYVYEAFLPQAIPHGAQIAKEQLQNKVDYTGMPIVSHGLDRKFPEEQYDRYTSVAAIEIGKALGVSPKRVDHLLKNTFGSVGEGVIKTVLGTGENGTRYWLEREQELSDIPLFGTLFKRGGTQDFRSKLVNDVYEKSAYAQMVKHSGLEKNDEETARRILLQNATQALSAIAGARANTTDLKTRAKLSQAANNLAEKVLKDVSGEITEAKHEQFRREYINIKRESEIEEIIRQRNANMWSFDDVRKNIAYLEGRIDFYIEVDPNASKVARLRALQARLYRKVGGLNSYNQQLDRLDRDSDTDIYRGQGQTASRAYQSEFELLESEETK